MQCCSRFKAQITHERGRVAGLARKAVQQEADGRDYAKTLVDVDIAKANVAEIERRFVQHKIDAHDGGDLVHQIADALGVTQDDFALAVAR